MNNKIKVKLEDGNIAEAKILLNVVLKSDNKEYLVYSIENDEDVDADSQTINASELTYNEKGEIILKKIESENSWTEIKNIMRKIIKESTAE